MYSPENLEVTPDEWEWRKSFYGFEPADEKRLKGVKALAESFVHEVVDELYSIFKQHQETNRLILDEETLERLKESQNRYFLELFSGDYGEEYLRQRLKIGRVHHHIGLELEWYLGAYTHYQRLTQPRLMELYPTDVKAGLQVIDSMQKLITLDQSLSVTAYMAAREEQIRAQADQIEQLSSLVE